jgi:hypothetical protein
MKSWRSPDRKSWDLVDRQLHGPGHWATNFPSTNFKQRFEVFRKSVSCPDFVQLEKHAVGRQSSRGFAQRCESVRYAERDVHAAGRKVATQTGCYCAGRYRILDAVQLHYDWGVRPCTWRSGQLERRLHGFLLAAGDCKHLDVLLFCST